MSLDFKRLIALTSQFVETQIQAKFVHCILCSLWSLCELLVMARGPGVNAEDSYDSI